MIIPYLCRGIIEEVWPPNHVLNKFKTQYEYLVKILVDKHTQIPVRCVVIDGFGSLYNYCDTVLTVGNKVFVLLIEGDLTTGVIIGGSRFYPRPVNPKLGIYHAKRFNELTELFSSKGVYTLNSDKGPFFTLGPTKIELSDKSGESIVIDKNNKRISITCKDWIVDVQGNCTINVKNGNTVINTKKADITVETETNLITKDAKIKASGKINVEASGNVSVTGSEINLNGSLGDVVTTQTHPICFVTGAPIRGTKKVKAG